MLLKDYLNSLKQQNNLSWNDISELSGLPIDTVRSIFYGRTTDPRLDTITRIVYAMGGSLDDISSKEQIVKQEFHSERDIASIKENYEIRLRDKDEYIAKLEKDKRIFMIVSGVLVLCIIVITLVTDIF